MQTSISSGTLSASTLIFTGKALLTGVVATADGTNAATITVYDNTSAVEDATHRILWTTVVPIGSRNQTVWFPFPVTAKTGLFVAISGTGAGVIVHRG